MVDTIPDGAIGHDLLHTSNIVIRHDLFNGGCFGFSGLFHVVCIFIALSVPFHCIIIYIIIY